MTGYDLDGVICVEKSWWKILYKFIYRIAVWVRDKHKPQFIPTGEFVIVTNRPEEDRASTLRWLAKYGIKPKNIYFSDHASPFSSSSKINYIRHLSIDKFIESDRDIAEEIGRNCKDVEVYVWPEM